MASDSFGGLAAISGSSCLIALLAYGSQVLFHFIDPGPLEGQQLYTFNVLVGCVWICYFQACFVDPGTIPKTWKLKDPGQKPNPARWCKKCDAPKPPRTHHCKTCKKCVPKMDHHCPWTANCVSHRTFPHFMRFLFYSVAAMIQLVRLLFARVNLVWSARDLPSYLGPSAFQLCALFILFAVNCMSLFLIGIIFLRTVYCLGTNITAIESWEIERHAVLVRRARKRGGYLEGADGSQVRIVKTEFPYDIGIWQNISQGMSGSFLEWFLPIGVTPSVESGLDFETNGFNDPGLTWPPPDPDKLARASRPADTTAITMELNELTSDQDRIRAFKERQAADIRRRTTRPATWRNSEGEALADYGVDEEAEEEDDDNIPLAKLLEQRHRGVRG